MIKLLFRVFLSVCLIGTAAAGAVECDDSNFDEVVFHSHKNAFVKFYAPWCKHCKSMKPNWDKLADLYKNSETIVIVDVNCDPVDEYGESTGKKPEICTKNNVEAFPTLMYWRDFGASHKLRPFDQEKYGNTLADFEEFVSSFLDEPHCNPILDRGCSEEDRKLIQQMNNAEDPSAYYQEYMNGVREWNDQANEKHKALIDEADAAFEQDRDMDALMKKKKKLEADHKKEAKARVKRFGVMKKLYRHHMANKHDEL
mmetsp:Transcript_19833/g.23796  ORF Transcript_19833/g.23796 Transcript_19833/m.23796 type:complete len:256 (+) Transcript_19833:2-769(+)